ncbi:GNAT family N-acetyltransferase [Planctobacterium marinum]|uniref:GNAT family N-acetyltransferase n=1 Tax=Planctobacterium marinum TaxID=1631968 RepID=UPI001E556889|nr:GNAT family N-acetyltransferase [Planctobacterium marinum]MCC2607320.1 GNAT family N-acetyltransferase [Planctobacterium marinum]
MTDNHAQQKLELSDDKQLLDVELIHDFLANQSYWAKDISLERVVVSLENSLCIGAYLGNHQVGFVRVITDYATYANIKDVFVVPAYRGNGIARELMRFTMAHPHLQGLRRMTLTSSDARGLYEKFGFAALQKPDTHMEIHCPDIYKQLSE